MNNKISSFLEVVTSNDATKSIALIITLTRSCRSWVKAPSCLKRLWNLSWLSELEVAGLLRYDGALVLRGQLWNKFCDKSASFLWIKITNLLGNINKGSNHLEMVKSMQF